MTFEIRAPEADELRPAADVMAAALLSGPSTDESWEQSLPSRHESDTLIALDGRRVVAHLAGFRFSTYVPGGASLPTSGLTRVGVLPTATRQGLLTRMLRQLLVEARERGQVLSSLRASEARIYGRFGYGLAGHAQSAEIDTRAAQPVRGPDSPGTVRLLERHEVLDVVPAAYERAARQRPGALTRPEWMWRRYLKSALPGEHVAAHVAVHRNEDGVDDGFCHYEVTFEESFSSHPVGKMELNDLWAATPAAEAALWRFVVGIDLVRSIRAEERPVDDIARWIVDDPRSYAVRYVWDEQWVRLLDVDAALRGRAYHAGRPVTIRVTDPWFPDNDGVWRVSADGAERLATEGQADLEASIDVISATYLGGTSWSELSRAGRVHSTRADAVADADVLFTSWPAPFCGSFF